MATLLEKALAALDSALNEIGLEDAAVAAATAANAELTIAARRARGSLQCFWETLCNLGQSRGVWLDSSLVEPSQFNEFFRTEFVLLSEGQHIPLDWIKACKDFDLAPSSDKIRDSRRAMAVFLSSVAQARRRVIKKRQAFVPFQAKQTGVSAVVGGGRIIVKPVRLSEQIEAAVPRKKSAAAAVVETVADDAVTVATVAGKGTKALVSIELDDGNGDGLLILRVPAIHALNAKGQEDGRTLQSMQQNVCAVLADEFAGKASAQRLAVDCSPPYIPLSLHNPLIRSDGPSYGDKFLPRVCICNRNDNSNDDSDDDDTSSDDDICMKAIKSIVVSAETRRAERAIKETADNVIKLDAEARRISYISETPALTPLNNFTSAVFGPSSNYYDPLQSIDNISCGRSHSGEVSPGIFNSISGETFFEGVIIDGVFIRLSDFCILKTSFVKGSDSCFIDRTCALPRANPLTVIQSIRRGDGTGYFYQSADAGAPELRDPYPSSNSAIINAIKDARALAQLPLSSGASIDLAARGPAAFALSLQFVQRDTLIGKITAIKYDHVARIFILHFVLAIKATDSLLGESGDPNMLFLVESQCASTPASSFISKIQVQTIDTTSFPLIHAHATAVETQYALSGSVPVQLKRVLSNSLSTAEEIFSTSGGPIPLITTANGLVQTHTYDHVEGAFRTGASIKQRPASLPLLGDNFIAVESVCVPPLVIGGQERVVLVPVPNCPSCCNKQLAALRGQCIPLGNACGAGVVDGVTTTMYKAVVYNDFLVSVGQCVYIDAKTRGAQHFSPDSKFSTASTDAFKAAQVRSTFSLASHPRYDANDSLKNSTAALAHAHALSWLVILIHEIHVDVDKNVTLRGVHCARDSDLPDSISSLSGQAHNRLFLSPDNTLFFFDVGAVKGVASLTLGAPTAYLPGIFHHVFTTQETYSVGCAGDGLGNDKLLIVPAAARRLGRSVAPASPLDTAAYKAGIRCLCARSGSVPQIILLSTPIASSACKQSLLLLSQAAVQPLNAAQWPRISPSLIAELDDINPCNVFFNSAPLVVPAPIPTVSLCSGFGGLDKGLIEAGASTISLAIEGDKTTAKQLFKTLVNANARYAASAGKAFTAPPTEIIVDDIAKRLFNTTLTIPAGHLGPPGAVEAVIGGPSCCHFSGSNRFKDSLRSRLNGSVFLSAVGAIISSHAKFSLLEEVVAITRSPYFAASMAALISEGYSVAPRTIKAQGSGAPTDRTRLILATSSPFHVIAQAPEPIHSTSTPIGCASQPDMCINGKVINANARCLGGSAPLPPVTIRQALIGVGAPVKRGNLSPYLKVNVGIDAMALRGTSSGVGLAAHTTLVPAKGLAPFVEAVPLFVGATAHDVNINVGIMPPTLMRGGARALLRLNPHWLVSTMCASSAVLGARSPPPLAVDRNTLTTVAEFYLMSCFHHDDIPTDLSPAEGVRLNGNSVVPPVSRHLGDYIMRTTWLGF